MARRLTYLNKYALQILVLFGMTSFFMMVVLNQSENELAAAERVRRHKEELRERLRNERLSDYQALLFQVRNQPKSLKRLPSKVCQMLSCWSKNSLYSINI